MKRFRILLVFGLAILSVARADARRVASPFNDQRKGLIMGLATGPGFVYFDSDNDVNPGSVTKGSIGMELTVGYGFSNQVLGYLYYRGGLYADEVIEDYDNYFSKINTSTEEGRLHLSGLPFALFLIPFFADQHVAMGFGTRYYVRTRYPSWFFDLDIGPSLPTDPFEPPDGRNVPGSMKAGPGLSVGAGYEFGRHVAVSLQSLWSRGKGERVTWPDPFTPIVEVRTTWTAVSVKLQLEVMAY